MRIEWIERAKGLGILLVVFGHAWRGVEASGLDIRPGLFLAVDNAIYAFHMPLFFFLSGFVFLWSGQGGPLMSFAAGRGLRLIWPLALWTWIFFGVKLAAGGAQNSAVGLADFPVVPLPPFAHFWFLWALFLLHILVGALLRTLPGTWTGDASRRLAAVACVGAFLLVEVLPYTGPLWQPALMHLPYFLAGIGLSGLARLHVPWPMAVLFGVCALGLIALAVPGDSSALLRLAIVLALCLSIAGLTRQRGGWLSALGRASLAIYVMHTIFSAGLREVLLAADFVSIPLHLLSGTAAGLVLPWVIFRALQGRRAQLALGL